MKTIKWPVITALFLCAPLSHAWADIVPLTILSTNDIHSYLSPDHDNRGGLSRIAAYNKTVRASEKHVLILNAGDMASGTAVSSLFKGDPIFHVLNSMTTDAAVLGNHDFDYGWQRIRIYREIARFPLLCANAHTIGNDGTRHLVADDAYHIFVYGELKVAVIGVLTEQTPAMTTQFATNGVTFLPMVPTLETLIPEVASQSDIVIALTHAGFRQDKTIPNRVDGIDLIVGGHSHTVLKQAKEINGVPIIQAGENGYFIGRVDMTIDTDEDRIVDFSYSLIEVDASMESDPDTTRAVNEWESKVEKIVDRPLAEAVTDLSERDMMFIAEAAFLESTKADYAHQNSGGTRGEISKGVFSYRTVWSIFPFENTLVTTELPGKDIPDHFYGYKPIDPKRTYKIVTNSYVRDQWQRSYPELSVVQWEETGIAMRDSILRYMEKKSKINRVRLVK
jgi:2',3'-cyclic-nucleotide 2'-phosphodiesterase (5'-nucleotidase family)